MAKRPLPKQLDSLLAPYSQQLRDAFYAAIDDVKNRADTARLVRALEAGNIDEAVKALHISEAAFTPMDDAVRQAYQAGGSLTTAAIPSVGNVAGELLVVRFNSRNPIAEAWLLEYAGNMIRGIVQEQLEMTRNHLQASMMAGAGPRAAALDLMGRIDPRTGSRTGGVIGLTDYQAALVRNAEQQLASGTPADLRAYLGRTLRDKRFDRTVLKAIREGTPIPADLRARMIQQYRNSFLRYRGETIGRTEMLKSLHAAQYEGLRQAVEQGAVRPEQIRRVWKTAQDKAVRDTHSDMEGQTVSFGEPFETGGGVHLLYPGDPNGPPEEIINCRCYVFPRIDFLSNIGPAPAPKGFTEDRITRTVRPGSLFDGNEQEILDVYAPFAERFPNSKIALVSLEDKSFVQLTDPTNRSLFIRREFEEKGGRLEVEHAYFTLPDKDQSSGIARSFLKDSMDLYKNLDVDRITLQANIDVGGYAWAKYGFIPSQTSWDELSDGMKAQLHFTKQNYDPNTVADLMVVFDNPNPKSLWDIADMTVVEPLLGEKENLGKKFLLGAGWSGVLDMHDMESMTRFSSYVNK